MRPGFKCGGGGAGEESTGGVGSTVKGSSVKRKGRTTHQVVEG